MKIKGLMTAMLIAMVFCSGCFSYKVHNGSKQMRLERKVMESKDATAIKAYQDGDFRGIGIDVGNLEALVERPWTQLGAAVLDTVIAWGAYEGVKAIQEYVKDDSDDSKKGTTVVIKGNEYVQMDMNNSTVIGDGNTGNGLTTTTNVDEEDEEDED